MSGEQHFFYVDVSDPLIFEKDEITKCIYIGRREISKEESNYHVEEAEALT